MIGWRLAGRTLRLVAAVALAASAPAAAVPRSTPEAVEPSLSAINADQAAFGQWLGRLGAIMQPMQEGLASTAAGAQALMTAPDVPREVGRLRAQVEALIATAGRVDAGLATLDTPDFPTLQLPADISTAAVKTQARELSRSVAAAYRNYLPVLDAVSRGDAAAAQRAFGPSMASMRLILESQLLMMRASHAAVPRDSSVWEMVNVQVLYNRVAVRFVQAWPPTGVIPNGAGVGRDIVALAGELERAAGQGDSRVDAELAQIEAPLADAERGRDAAAVAILRRQRLILTSGRALFPMARELAAQLRRDARAIPNGPADPELYLGHFQRLLPFRDRVLEIDRAMAAAMASGG